MAGVHTGVRRVVIRAIAETFKIAFPERPDDKIQKLAVNMSNKDGKICKLIITWVWNDT